MLGYIIIWRERPSDPAATRYLDNTAAVRGKPSIVVEAGHAGTTETDDITLLVNGTLSTMRALKMLPGEPHRIENPVWLDKIIDVTSDTQGIFYPYVKRGTYVSANAKLGQVTDFFGKVILEPRAPESGVVLHVNSVPSLKPGDNIANIGVVAPTRCKIRAQHSDCHFEGIRRGCPKNLNVNLAGHVNRGPQTSKNFKKNAKPHGRLLPKCYNNHVHNHAQSTP